MDPKDFNMMDKAVKDEEKDQQQEVATNLPFTLSNSTGPLSDEQDLVRPVALLLDELKSEEVILRIEAMRRLRTISLALGPERTRKELLSFLMGSLDDDEEVLATLAGELGGMLDYVGGVTFGHCLLPLLESLASVDEPLVRNKALNSFEILIEVLPVQHAVPSVERLASGSWFAQLNSASAIIVAIIKKLNIVGILETNSTDPDLKLTEEARQAVIENLLNIFARLSTDESPLVRKVVVDCSGKMAAYVDIERRVKNLLPICAQFASDPQDSVRQLSVQALSFLLEQGLGEQDEEAKNLTQSLFIALASDESWRVRLMVASLYGDLARSVKLSEAVDIIGIFSAILADPEAEVRSAAASQLSAVASLANSAMIEDQILAGVRLLLSDPSPHVRASLALQLNDFAKVLGKEIATNQILPMILQFLRDDSSEVRLNVIAKLDVIVDVIGIDQLSISLFPAIVALSEDRQWRVRQTIIEYLPELACHLGKEFFQEKLADLLVSWLCDPVFAVRETAVDSVKGIIRHFGCEWASSSGLLQTVFELRHHRNYLRRQTLLAVIASTCAIFNVKILEEYVSPVLQQLASDPVPNVRLNVARTLESLVPVLASSPSDYGKKMLEAPIIPILQQLERDADTDVHEFANKALNLVPAF